MKKIESPFTWSVFQGELGILFHVQVPDGCSKPHARIIYEAVAPEQATVFSTFQEAMNMAMEHNVTKFTIQQSERKEAA